MVLDISFEQMIKLIGHDGSELLWPSLGEPLQRAAFHIEEIQYAARKLGFAFIYYAWGIKYQPAPNCESILAFEDKFREVTKTMDGILLGIGQAGTYHAVAWNHKEGKIYDPNGTIYDAHRFVPEAFYGVTRLSP